MHDMPERKGDMREVTAICVRYVATSQAIRLTHDMKKHTHNMSRWFGDMRSICGDSICGDIRTHERREFS